MGLDKLIEFLLDMIEDLLPTFTVRVFEQSVVLRFGRIHRVKSAGMYWKIPFLDQPITYMVVTTTIETGVQTLTTEDGEAISINAVVKYNINDVKLHTESIYDAQDAITDITQGHIMNEINHLDYEACRDTVSLSNAITKKVRNEVKRYGIYIEQITLTNFIKTRNYRLFNDD